MLGDYDRRKKLTKDERERIQSLYKTGRYTQKDLAEMFGVCTGTVGLTVSEKRRETKKRYTKKNWRKWKQETTVRTKSNRKLRCYKRSLYKAGLIERSDEE